VFLFWAYVAGLLTLINPCVLPILPIIIASALQSSRLGPLALAAGLVVSFTTFGVGVAAFGHLIGLNEFTLNRIASVLMILFGLPWWATAGGYIARRCLVTVYRPNAGWRNRPCSQWRKPIASYSHHAVFWFRRC